MKDSPKLFLNHGELYCIISWQHVIRDTSSTFRGQIIRLYKIPFSSKPGARQTGIRLTQTSPETPGFLGNSKLKTKRVQNRSSGRGGKFLIAYQNFLILDYTSRECLITLPHYTRLCPGRTHCSVVLPRGGQR